MIALTRDNLRPFVHQVVNDTPILDVHTHLYSPRFGRQLLFYGIDELLTYHYFIAEVFRVAPMPYEQFWRMSKPAQADYVFKHLFIERSPVSESCRGFLTVLHAFGLDGRQGDLDAFRRHWASLSVEQCVDLVFAKANIRSLIMTNDPFDDLERPIWQQSKETDPRFQAALRIDAMLSDWRTAAGKLKGWGYDIRGDLGPSDIDQVRRFLRDWVQRIGPRYLAASLPPEFAFPEDSPRAKLVEHCVLPVAREAGVPFAMMIGVRRQVNPGLRLAGDAVGRADVSTVSRLCAQFPDNRFLVTMLSRENQHELCVVARKHPNLLVFGCWWFVNNPSIIEEITRERFELLGLSFVPQHSDARVLEQVVYKWAHSRTMMADILANKYEDLADSGWAPTEDEIRRDVADLFGDVFERFCTGAKSEVRSEK